MKPELYKVIDSCIGCNGTAPDVAKVVFEMYKKTFKYSKDSKTLLYNWYCLNHNKEWEPIYKGFQLYSKLSNDVSDKFKERSLYWMIEATKMTTDDYELRRLNYRCKALEDIAAKLKTGAFKDAVMKECGNLFK